MSALGKLIGKLIGNLIALKNLTSGGEENCSASARVVFNDQEAQTQTVAAAFPLQAAAPLLQSYNDRIRPLLDCVDMLRRRNITQEGIQLPTIVVVGDQSSGKSSVLESLAGIQLPRGQGICTRVPLIMRLQHHSSPLPELYLEYNGKVVSTDESSISEAISLATDEIAGNGKGISNTPLTLVVKKNGVPDLTMVDLPGITRVPVHGQPEDIYEQISSIIMEYITPEESIILNVLSATVDFPTCESIRMSQRVDKTGQRTLAVVTKVDKAPEGLLEKVTADDVNIGLGYVCVRNRIGNESYEEARDEEVRLFKTHPLLSKIEKSMVSIPVLAQKLVQIQATIISKCLPEIVRMVNERLATSVMELNSLPQKLNSVAEALTAFVSILRSSGESLRKILLRGEFDEYADNKEMHCTARLAEMLEEFSDEVHSSPVENDAKGNFLMEEISALEEAKAISLPNFLPRSAFLDVLKKRVKAISSKPIEFVERVWNYIEEIVVVVLMHHSDNYPQLHHSTRRAAQNLIAKTKDKSVAWVMEMAEMEKLADYTCSPEYNIVYSQLMACQSEFMQIMNDHSKPPYMTIQGFGKINVEHLRQHEVVVQQQEVMVQQAFDLKMRVAAYWKIVSRRMVDQTALQLLLSIKRVTNEEMEIEIIKELLGPHGGGLEGLLEESPSIAARRQRLNKRILLLKESKDVVAKVMNTVSINT